MSVVFEKECNCSRVWERLKHWGIHKDTLWCILRKLHDYSALNEELILGTNLGNTRQLEQQSKFCIALFPGPFEWTWSEVMTLWGMCWDGHVHYIAIVILFAHSVIGRTSTCRWRECWYWSETQGQWQYVNTAQETHKTSRPHAWKSSTLPWYHNSYYYKILQFYVYD